jgi:hypothetical protein
MCAFRKHTGAQTINQKKGTSIRRIDSETEINSSLHSMKETIYDLFFILTNTI